MTSPFAAKKRAPRARSHPGSGETLHVMINAYWEDLEFELPVLEDGRVWKRIINTELNSPEDFMPPEKAESCNSRFVEVKSRSIMVLFGV